MRFINGRQKSNPTEGKFAYADEEIRLLADRINNFPNAADRQGVVLVFENTIEALSGEG